MNYSRITALVRETFHNYTNLKLEFRECKIYWDDILFKNSAPDFRRGIQNL